MDKLKVLLFGSTGMAGHMIYHFLNKTDKYQIVDVTFRTKLTENSRIVDVTNKKDVENIIRDVHPDLIINSIGVLVKGSQQCPDNAIFINAYFPHFLKRISDEIDAKLIHISTDCVFSGRKGNYSETDFKDADDIYGRSKALGEIINNKDLTIRTSIIGPELKKDGEGLFHWFMNQQGKINGYVNAIWGGVTTLELAKAIELAIENNLTGLVQLSNGAAISKYNLLCLIKEIWHRDNEIIPYQGDSIDKSIKKSSKFSYEVPSYKQMLIELREWMLSGSVKYNLYSE